MAPPWRAPPNKALQPTDELACARPPAAERRYVGRTLNFAEHTTTAFGDLPPVGHVLRSAISTRWLRVHSLPNSKRYAETQREHDELLLRYNELAAEILASDAPAIVFLHSWGAEADFADAFADFGWAAQLELKRAKPTVHPTPDPDDPNLLVAGFPIQWSPHAWDSLIRDVADDRLRSILFLNPTTGEAYAPYDGGADLFLANSERVEALSKRWAAWLSTRPDGL